MGETPEKSEPGARIIPPPKREEIRPKVREWIRWIRENLDMSADVPRVRDMIQQMVKDQEGHAILSAFSNRPSLEHLESCFADELTPAPADIPARAAALCCFWWCLELLQTEIEEQTESGEPGWRDYVDHLDDERSAALGHLGFFVRFLPVEECPAEWPYFRWEILNSYLARDWDRALRLYRRAEDLQLKSREEIWLIRAQFRFLLVLGTSIERRLSKGFKKDLRLVLDSLQWEPTVYWGRPDDSEGDKVFAGILLWAGMSDDDPEPSLTDAEREHLLDAAHDLEKANRCLSDLPSCYRSILARSCFCAGRFSQAADQYERLLHTGLDPFGDSLRGSILASLTLSHRRAGELDRAKETLKRFISEYPKRRGLYLELAEIEAQLTCPPFLVQS